MLVSLNETNLKLKANKMNIIDILFFMASASLCTYTFWSLGSEVKRVREDVKQGIYILGDKETTHHFQSMLFIVCGFLAILVLYALTDYVDLIKLGDHEEKMSTVVILIYTAIVQCIHIPFISHLRKLSK